MYGNSVVLSLFYVWQNICHFPAAGNIGLIAEVDGEDRRLREDVEDGMEHGHEVRVAARPEGPEPRTTGSRPRLGNVMRDAAKRPPEALFNEWDKWC